MNGILLPKKIYNKNQKMQVTPYKIVNANIIYEKDDFDPLYTLKNVIMPKLRQYIPLTPAHHRKV